MTETTDTTTASGETLETKVARLEKQVAFLERKRLEYRDNWKRFAQMAIESGSNGEVGGAA